MALFLARWVTFAAKKFEKAFGREALRSACQAFERTLEMAMEEASHVETIMAAARARGLPLSELELRQQAVEYWGYQLRDRMRLAAHEVQMLQDAGALSEREVERMQEAYGPLAVLPLVEVLQASARHAIPPGFAEALLAGEELSRDRGLDAARIDEYEAGIKRTGMDACLPWMAPWLRFQVAYRRRDDAAAWNWIVQAYESARYRAGQRQYEILNYYVEMAAKMGNGSSFRKGVLWADYIGLQVRWLRDKEITPESLADTMAMLRIARYPL